jgi:hypothetical protein
MIGIDYVAYPCMNSRFRQGINLFLRLDEDHRLRDGIHIQPVEYYIHFG